MSDDLQALANRYVAELQNSIAPAFVTGPRGDLAREVKAALTNVVARDSLKLNLLDQRDLVTLIMNGLLAGVGTQAPPATAPVTAPAPQVTTPSQAAVPEVLAEATAAPVKSSATLASVLAETAPQAAEGSAGRSSMLAETKGKIQPLLLDRIDTSAAAKMSRDELRRDITNLASDVLAELRLQLNSSERAELVNQILDDMLGLGPLEPLLADESISEIMVNGPKKIYVEQKGKLTLTEVTFRDNAHAQAVCTRIVTAIGRRIDETTPLCDARLADGSRVNIIIPPLALDGPTITIRKFSKKKITLDVMENFGSLSNTMKRLLQIAGRCRCNILISGGTGSGKTTLLNAISQQIDHGERIVTIEDAAELQLQQPHVVRLETRPANLEGTGEITMRDLLKNSLRMRPDRIIVGETRGGEAIDMLQAMNTGHDGSFSTVHANRPREALMRLENMVGLAGVNLAPRAIRQLIASAVDLIVQVSRMRDGSRKITHISEVVGMEGEIITMQDLYLCEVTGEDENGKLLVDFKSTGLRPAFMPKAAYYGLDKELMELL